MTRGHAVFATSALALALAASPAQAQQRQAGQANSPAVSYLSQVPASEQPDVVLDVPNLSVEQLTLEVQGLEAHISLDARLANLLRLNAGADVTLESVKLDIKGVQASAALVVRLEPSGDERIDVERNLPRGKSTYRNLDLRLTIEGRLADPAAARADASVTIQDQGD